ncbi:unnamed protein product [Orchesella dallaii]|uniref:Solute carrier family 35 member F1 n=1 Tax=Orchesella dallaii TaxID=48710 RepID=A0ABP1QGC8_9HEXA
MSLNLHQNHRELEHFPSPKQCCPRCDYDCDCDSHQDTSLCNDTSNYHSQTKCSGRVEAGVNNNDPKGCTPSSGPNRQGICDRIEAQLEHLGKGTTWLAIFLGQVLSGILCVSAVTSVYLIDYYKIHVPNAQNFAFYIALAAIFTTILACRPAERNLFPILRTRGWKYALVALVDAEANFAVGKAYQFTTLTSVQLLDCFTIPTVLSLSWLVLRIRYKVPHILGVSICLLGVSCLVWADIEEGKPLAQGKDRFLGDMICLAGAFLYGISNVAQEFVVKTFDIVEFLGMIGLFGSFVSGAQTVLLEYGAVTSTDWAGPSTQMALLIGFAVAKFFFYILSAVVMKLSSATAFNLSILTADFYSLITGIYLFHFKFHALYFLSFLLVMTGVILFAIKPTVIDSHIYRSLTREHTTTLDLELMASTPSSLTGYHNSSEQQLHLHQNHHQNQQDKNSSFVNRHVHHNHNHNNHHDDEVCIGGAGSLLTETSHLLSDPNNTNGNNVVVGRSPMLSNQSCDVVLQTTCSGAHANNGKGNNGNANSNSSGGTQTSWTGNNEMSSMMMKNGFDNSASTYVIPEEDETCS